MKPLMTGALRGALLGIGVLLALMGAASASGGGWVLLIVGVLLVGITVAGDWR